MADDQASSPPPAAQDPSIAAFLSYCTIERRLAAKTLSSYSLDLGQFTRLLPNGLVKATRDDVRAAFAELQAGGLEPRSLGRKMSTLRQFYRYIRRKGIVTGIPLRNILLPKMRKALPKPVNDEDFAKLLRAADAHTPQGLRDLALLRTLDSCGLRVSELVRLLRDDLHLEEGYIIVRSGKGDKDRFAPIDAPGVQALRNYMERGRPALMDATVSVGQISSESACQAAHAKWAKAKENDARIFPFTRQRVWQILRKLCVCAGLPAPKHPHQLRHRLGSSLVQAGLELREVADILGHASTDTTEIYVALDLSYIREVFRKSHPRAVLP